MLLASHGVHVGAGTSAVRRAVMLVVVCVVLGGSLFGARTAWAHSGLAAASPGPDTIVGGRIDIVQLFYGDIILDFDATLTSPSGAVLDAEPVMLSEITAEVRLAEPLSEAGDYELRHTILSFDDDLVEATYGFTYEPGADPPILTFIEEATSSGWAWWIWVIIGLGVVVIAILAARLVLALRTARSGSE